jgi:hypothetical protein
MPPAFPVLGFGTAHGVVRRRTVAWRWRSVVARLYGIYCGRVRDTWPVVWAGAIGAEGIIALRPCNRSPVRPNDAGPGELAGPRCGGHGRHAVVHRDE